MSHDFSPLYFEGLTIVYIVSALQPFCNFCNITPRLNVEQTFHKLLRVHPLRSDRHPAWGAVSE